jgi:hypothetical protein
LTGKVEADIAALGFLGGFEGVGFFLGHPDEDHPFGLSKLLAVLRSHVVFALFRLKMHHRDLVLVGKTLDRLMKLLANLTQQGRRWNRMTPMFG